MRIVNKVLIVLFLLFSKSVLFAQIKVTGRVLDQDKNPLPGVSILVKGTSKGVASDFDGKYSLEVKDGSVLEFRFVGFETHTQKVSGNKNQVINVSLKEQASALQEVVVTGYGGTQQKTKVTTSIATVKKENFEKGSFSNPAQALSGAVAGLSVKQTTGALGAVPTITLRGGTNLDGTGSPLVIVDGLIRGGMNDINPNDIESMEVLKDAGATAIYGARANNGVILITTKKGKNGHSSINFNVKNGFSFMNNHYEFLNARDYLYWQRSAVYNSSRIYQDSNGNWQGYSKPVSLNNAGPYGTGNKHFDAQGNVINPNMGSGASGAYWSTMFSETLTSEQKQQLLNEGWETMVDPVTGKELIFSSSYDPSRIAFRPMGITQDYSVSMQGGNEKGGYYAGLGLYNQTGLTLGSLYKRVNFTLNGDYKIKPWLKSISNFSIVSANWENNANDLDDVRYFGRMLSVPPTQKEYVNGELVLGPDATDGNPTYNAGKFYRDNNTIKTNFGQTLKFDILKGLSFDLNASIMLEDEYLEHFNKDYLKTPNKLDTTRSSSASFGRTIRQTYSGIFHYKKEFGKHSLDALAGYEFLDTYSRSLKASGEGAPTDDFIDLGLTITEAGKRGIDSGHSRFRTKSYFGRLNYDYDAKYLLTFTLRKDGYSSLLGDNRWGIFPSASVGWVFTKENFTEKWSDVLSFGKFRMSYGLNGNASNIGAYTLQGTYNTQKYKNEVTYHLGALPNPGLRWESSHTFETGLDLRFLQNRIGLNIAYYNRITFDKYADMPLVYSSGRDAITTNTGKLRNRGFEIETNFDILKTNDWKWDLSVNAAYNINTVLKLQDNGLERNRQNAFQVWDGTTGNKKWVGGYQEGERYGDIYVYIAEGIFRDDAQVRELALNRVDNVPNAKILYGPEAWEKLTDAQKEKGLPIQPGDVIWKDVNNDGKIDTFDREKIGNIFPTWTGGINTSVSYKNLKLSTRMDFALNFVQVLNGFSQGSLTWILGNGQGTYNATTDVFDTWTPQNPNAKYPRYMWADQLGKYNYFRDSSLFAYDASYLAFREVSLSYTFDKKILDKIGVSGLELSLTGQNLGYLTKSMAYSPEQGGSVGVGNKIPRTFIVGLNLTF